MLDIYKECLLDQYTNKYIYDSKIKVATIINKIWIQIHILSKYIYIHLCTCICISEIKLDYLTKFNLECLFKKIKQLY